MVEGNSTEGLELRYLPQLLEKADSEEARDGIKLWRVVALVIAITILVLVLFFTLKYPHYFGAITVA
jgi:hypothetical protein